MKKLALLLVLFTAVSLFAQNADKTPTSFRFNGTALTAVALTVENPYGSMNVSFEELFTGGPATTSVVILGCMRGGTCDAALDTQASATNSIKAPSITKPYDYFKVTPTFTGGTAPLLTLNVTEK